MISGCAITCGLDRISNQQARMPSQKRQAFSQPCNCLVPGRIRVRYARGFHYRKAQERYRSRYI